MKAMYGVVGSDGVVYGPVPAATLYEWIASGRVVASTTLIDWQGRHLPASMAPELHGAFPAASPSPAIPTGAAVPYGPPLKSRKAALWLAFFLGPFGAHRFYLGHTASGIAMLALNLASLAFLTNLTMAIGLGVLTTGWLIVDMARIAGGGLREANGRPLA